MSKHWDDIFKNFETEIKSELVKNYYSEKIFIEEIWKAFREDLKELEERSIFEKHGTTGKGTYYTLKY